MHSGNRNTKNDRPVFTSNRLLDQLRERLRYLHYSLRTEKNYAYWVRFLIRWHGVRHPRDMGGKEVETFQTKRIPVVLTVAQVKHVLVLMDGVTGLLARLLYDSGMRLREGLSLRVKDVDFDRNVIIVREGKGGKDRVVMLPKALKPALKQQLAYARAVWEADRQAQLPSVFIPQALEKKYPPTMSRDPRSGIVRRWRTDVGRSLLAGCTSHNLYYVK